MRKAFTLFWLVFIAYFIFVHPAIIYYATSFPNPNLADANPTLAMGYLGLSVLLWLLVFSVSLRLIIKYTITAKKNIIRLNESGRRLSSKIIESKTNNNNTTSILLELNNLQNEKITHRLEFKDRQPEKRRFTLGNQIYLRVDETFKKNPYVVIEGTQSRINPLPFLLWALFIVGVVYYGYYTYHLESAGYGWRFLQVWHPLVLCPALVFLLGGFYYAVVTRSFLKSHIGGVGDLSLKFQGRKTMATINNVRQTGTYINEQPEVAFDITYNDDMRRTHHKVIKKIVSLLEVGSVSSHKQLPVFYNPKNPEIVQFEQDIND